MRSKLILSVVAMAVFLALHGERERERHREPLGRRRRRLLHRGESGRGLQRLRRVREPRRGVDECTPGDVIHVVAGTYGDQTITGDKSGAGCTIEGDGADTTTIGELLSYGDGVTLEHLAIDVGAQHGKGWGNFADHVTLDDVPLRGLYVSAYVTGSDVAWKHAEFGEAGVPGGERGLLQRGLRAVDDHERERRSDRRRPLPSSADSDQSSVQPHGDDPDRSGHVGDHGSAIELSPRGRLEFGDDLHHVRGRADPTDLTIANNFFGGYTQASSAIKSNGGRRVLRRVHDRLQHLLHRRECGVAMHLDGRHAHGGQRRPKKGGVACYGTYDHNVWQHNFDRSGCGDDTWVPGPAYSTSELGLTADGHLLPGSPGIDAGESDYCTGALGAVDHDGAPRPRGAACGRRRLRGVPTLRHDHR